MILQLKSPYSLVDDSFDKGNTLGVGIAAAIVFFTIVVYSAYTSNYRSKTIGLRSFSKGKQSIAMSEIVYHSERVITSFFSILLIVLFVYLFYRQNFFQPETLRWVTAFLLSSTPLIFIIFTYLGPTHWLHAPLAITVFMFGTISTFLIIELYKKYYQSSNVLTTFQTLVYVLVGTIALMFITFSITYMQFINKKIRWFVNDIFGLLEYTHLFFFSILLILFSTFEPLPDVIE